MPSCQTLCPSKPSCLLFLSGTDVWQGRLCSVLVCFAYCTDSAAGTGLVPCLRKDMWPLETSLVSQVPAVHTAARGARFDLGPGLHVQLLRGRNPNRSQVTSAENALSQSKPFILKHLSPGFLAFLHKQLLAGL